MSDKHEIFEIEKLSQENQENIKNLRSYIDKFKFPIQLSVYIEGYSLDTFNDNAIATTMKVVEQTIKDKKD